MAGEEMGVCQLKRASILQSNNIISRRFQRDERIG